METMSGHLPKLSDRPPTRPRPYSQTRTSRESQSPQVHLLALLERQEPGHAGQAQGSYGRVTMLGTLSSASPQGLETYLSILVAMVTVKVPSVSGR